MAVAGLEVGDMEWRSCYCSIPILRPFLSISLLFPLSGSDLRKQDGKDFQHLIILVLPLAFSCPRLNTQHDDKQEMARDMTVTVRFSHSSHTNSATLSLSPSSVPHLDQKQINKREMAGQNERRRKEGQWRNGMGEWSELENPSTLIPSVPSIISVNSLFYYPLHFTPLSTSCVYSWLTHRKAWPDFRWDFIAWMKRWQWGR